MQYYLMVKEAVGLGIKYLCKCGDYRDPVAYEGSGVYWQKIIKKHKCEIKTVILGVYDSKEKLREAGEYYSKLYNVVGNTSWANVIPEIGDGGSTTKGTFRAYNPATLEQKCFKSIELIPIGWIRGNVKWKKNREGVERTRKAHLNSKRKEETRNRMSEAWGANLLLNSNHGKPRVPCIKCSKPITVQNIKNHERVCRG